MSRPEQVEQYTMSIDLSDASVTIQVQLKDATIAQARKALKKLRRTLGKKRQK